MKNKTEDNPTIRTDRHRRRNRAGRLSALLFVLCHVSAVIGLTACTDDIAPTDEPVAGSPVELTARVAGHVQTRATADNTWEGGEEVGVQLDGKCYKYIADASGKLTPAPGQEIPRWSSINDTKTIVAWYPYSDKLPETFTIEKNQRGNIQNYYKSDFLLAKETQITFGNPEITFRHLPAKIVINLKLGDGVTDEDVSDLKVSIHNNFSDAMHATRFASGKINPVDGTVENLPARIQKDSLLPTPLTSPASGYIKSFQALLMPLVLTKGVPFFKVYTIQEGWFYYTPQSDDELTVESGKKYVYNITVMKDGLSVVRNEGVDEWDTEKKDIPRKETKEGYRAHDLKPFDYYYSDGTWSDGGYRRYADNTEAWLDIAPTEGKQVIAIVFQADKKRISQAEKSKGWEHGYAVAVTVCGDQPYISRNTWEWGIYGSHVPGMENDALTTFTACKNFIFGYEATQKVIKAIGNGQVEALRDTKYQAFYQACQYGKTDNTKQYAAPDGTSGWYLPSVGQWWDIAENLFGCKLDTQEDDPYGGQVKPYTQRNITTQLSWIPGAHDFQHDYWTSSIYSAEQAYYIGYDKKNNEISLYVSRKNDERYVRAVLAF